VLWLIRHRSRAPLSGFLFFAGTLFPVLGFFNVYPFLFSFVADHFQYLASLGVITLASAGATLLFRRLRIQPGSVGVVLCLALLATLGTLTWWQCGMYANAETLYRATLKQNPDSWMAHNNLGIIFANSNRSGRPLNSTRRPCG